MIKEDVKKKLISEDKLLFKTKEECEACLNRDISDEEWNEISSIFIAQTVYLD